MRVDFSLLFPEMALAALGFLVLVVDLILPQDQVARRNAAAAAVAVLGMVAVGALAVVTTPDRGTSVYGGLLFIDAYALLFKLLFLGVGIAVVLMSAEYVGRVIRHPGEFYGLVVFSVLGSALMASAGELLTAYVALELLSFCLFVLVGLTRGDRRSAEASTKYILLGAISSAVMLYGISLLYGTAGTTVFPEMGAQFWANFSPTVIVGFAMLLAGFGFKLALVPFHLWAPDVYEGAPTPVTALVAVLSKAATFALLLRFLAEASLSTFDEWQLALAVLAALTMTVGTLTALAQHNIKRLFAYSSIAQVGFVMVGVVAMTEAAANAVLLHLVGYAFSNLAAFAVIVSVEAKTRKEEIADYAGLSTASPLMAMVLTAALFSLAGLPIFAGFITKFYLFTTAADAGYLWLAVLAIANSVISLYYYLRIVREMYITEPAAAPERIRLPAASAGALWALLAGTIAIGVYPGPVAAAVDAATDALGPFVGAS
ncbi:MAG: NADH-quinone oxidoreductase subunit N [Chloroflexi bacterium]|nr:NADH-quinone oxidoreductase subunit N [Chloroflexota bacterium]